jgi:hypothetical protein
MSIVWREFPLGQQKSRRGNAAGGFVPKAKTA